MTAIVVVPLTLPDAAVITAEPAATPVTTPLELTVARFADPEDQFTVAAMALPFWSFGLATRASDAPTATVLPPDTAIDVSTGVEGGGGGGAGGGVVGELLPPEQPSSAAAAAAITRVLY